MSVDPLVDSLNRLIFHLPQSDVPQTNGKPKDTGSEKNNGANHLQKEYFPLRLSISKENVSSASLKSLKSELSKNHWRWSQNTSSVELAFSNKSAADAATRFLLDKKWTLSFDYSRFVSHPGTLFVKHLARASVSEEKLQEYFNKSSKYGSVTDVNIISPQHPDDSEEVSAILKFENYLDVDHITSTLCLTENPFHSSLPLYINRYVSKRERAMCPDGITSTGDSSSSASSGSSTAHDDAVLYDTIVVENLGEFFSGKVTLAELESIVAKFHLFGAIDSMHFPLASEPKDTDTLSFRKVGFLCFAHEKNINQNILRCLYYLRDLTFDELTAFTKDDIYDIKDDVNKPHKYPQPVGAPRLKISIAQRKHNHHIYESNDALYVYNKPGMLNLEVCDPSESSTVHDDTFLNKFMKSLNYQETNVYVNNLPILFENDDQLWASFWNQFGVDGVKSAKIIKPQFYSKKSDESLGRIGFVFYEEFKMALRAIILTNNKIVNLGNGPGMAVQASFAIQKHNNSSGSGKSTSSSMSSGSIPNYNYYNHHDGFGKGFSLPMNDFYIPEPRIPHSTASPGTSPFIPPDYYYYPYYMSMQPPHPSDYQEGEENGSHSPKQTASTSINPNAPPFVNPMAYMYNPYYSIPQLPQPLAVPGNGQAPYFNNYSLKQQGAKEKKGERKRSC
ncbi:hypothetical_protein [Candidozyma auris]|uniref:hypothetical_protein n=1 Tax=Candidozyma auris TaxID=498019 RepID=UPI000D2B1735|nr:hypothetical_protein [[Candida] auris]QEO22350.1 hypothetical_protein [[Candida] auris]GBL51238.1 hypothetical protein CAJCM15448_35120 [[Candida] auris]